MKSGAITPIAGWALAICVLVWSAVDSIGHHARSDAEDWKTELRADAGGYYIYLPGFTHHRMRTGWISPERVRIIGDAIQQDTVRDLIITKYTCGTALLQLPFYLAAECVEGYGRTDGFTPTHHRAIDVAGIFYWWAGLVLLWSGLQRRWPIPWGIGLALVFVISQGSGVFYYAFRSPGASHIYSWFLVCVALWCWSHGLTGRARGLLFRIACAWLILIRPLDVLLVCALYGMAIPMDGNGVLRPRWLAGQALCGLVLALPQLIYWKAAYGSWVYFSYQGEGFSNWRSPYLLQTLLAPKSGLLPYAPMFLLLPIACWYAWKRERTIMALAGALFLLYWYAVSSWSEPTFGCSFGQRSFVQTVPVMSMVLWIAVRHAWPSRRWALFAFGSPFIALALINHMHAHLFDVCYWSSEWDWGQYLTELGKVLK